MNQNTVSKGSSNASFLKAYYFDILVMICLITLAVLQFNHVITYTVETILAGFTFIIWFIYCFKKQGRNNSMKLLLLCIVLEAISMITTIL